MVRNIPCNAEDAGLIPAPGSQVPHVLGQLSSHTATQTQCSQINKYFQKRGGLVWLLC